MLMPQRRRITYPLSLQLGLQHARVLEDDPFLIVLLPSTRRFDSVPEASSPYSFAG